MAKSARKVDLQIRGVPIELRRKVGRRAASKGVSISKYVIDLLAEDDGPRTIEEWLAEVERNLGPFGKRGGPGGGETIRELRDAWDRSDDP